MQCLFVKQPVDKVFGFDTVVRSIKTRLKGQHDFFVVIADTLKRCKLPLAHIFTHHRFCYLDILFLIGGRCNGVNLRIADFANRYIITTAKQFKIKDVLDGMDAITITKTQQIIAKSDVNDIVFSECTKVGFALDVRAFNLIEEVAFQNVTNHDRGIDTIEKRKRLFLFQPNICDAGIPPKHI